MPIKRLEKTRKVYKPEDFKKSKDSDLTIEPPERKVDDSKAMKLLQSLSYEDRATVLNIMDFKCLDENDEVQVQIIIDRIRSDNNGSSK